VSWEQARDFCRWLSERTGLNVQLPTEAQWEWACRAGSDGALSWGAAETDFGELANLADVSMKLLAVRGVNPKPIKNPDEVMDFVPAIRTVDDGTLHLAAVGSYEPNAWGLHDMHGNAAEWTRDPYAPYPFGHGAGATDATEETRHVQRVVRGGSWRSRPHWARAALRLDYPQWQKVYDTGFRIVVTE
jgi:formylglycine-generating enzyme required for sulfatase activity